MDNLVYQNKIQDGRLDAIEKMIALIKDNHLSHIQTDIAKVITDVDWLKRFFWIIASASVSGLVVAVINLIVSIKA